MDARWPYVPRSVECWRVKPDPDAGAGGVSEAAVCPVLDDLLPDPHTLEALQQTPPNDSHAAPHPMPDEVKQEPPCEVIDIGHELTELRECRVVLARLPVAVNISNTRGSEDRDGCTTPVDRACVEREHRDTAIGNVGGDSGDSGCRSPAMAPPLSGVNTVLNADSGARSPAPAMAPSVAVQDTGAVRETFPNITDDGFERLVMSWFQHAGTRLKRH